VCGDQIRANELQTTLYSHENYGTSLYENNYACDSIIEAEEGYKIDYSFTTFDLQPDISFECK